MITVFVRHSTTPWVLTMETRSKWPQSFQMDEIIRDTYHIVLINDDWTYVKTQFTGLPMFKNTNVQHYYGELAQFILGNL